MALADVDDEIQRSFRASPTRPPITVASFYTADRGRADRPRRSSPRRSCRGVIRRRRGLHRDGALRGGRAARTRRPRAGRSAPPPRTPPPDDDPPPLATDRRSAASRARTAAAPPVSRRSSDAYRGEPASTEAADPRDEGTVRGERDVGSWRRRNSTRFTAALYQESLPNWGTAAAWTATATSVESRTPCATLDQGAHCRCARQWQMVCRFAMGGA